MVSLQRKFVNEKSRRESDGRYVWGARVGIQWNVTVQAGAPTPVQEYVQFERRGHNFEDVEARAGKTDLLPIPVGHWRESDGSQAWCRYQKQSD